MINKFAVHQNLYTMPFIATILNKWRSFWDTYGRAGSASQSETYARQTDLLCNILKLLWPGTLLILLFWLVSNPELSTAPIIALSIFSILAIVHLLAYTNHTHTATIALISSIFFVVNSVILITNGSIVSRMMILNALIVAVLLASLLLSTKATLIVASLCSLNFAVFFFVPDVPARVVFALLTFSASASTIIVAIALVYHRFINQITLDDVRYRALFEQTHDAVFILTLEGQHVAANRRAADLLGYTTEEIQNLSVKELSAEPQSSEQARQRILHGEHIPQYERLFRKKNGDVVPVEITAELVYDENGRPLHIQSVVRDISQRKQAEQQARELTLEQERVRLLTQFITNTSHEFRTPLSVISTSLYLLAQTNDPEKRQKYAHRADTQIWRINRLLEMLLLISQLDSDTPVDLAPTNLN
ncbi:MAG: PAS domain S-box protein, partial [Anaerolineales bacterium]|nr:PAS domain S-box protein [Anaerolineales bacterium]